MRTARVAIVGGGLSDLYAATLLEQRGLRDYVLIEARDRFGGRIASMSSSAPASSGSSATPASHDRFDLGPTWYWPALQPQRGQGLSGEAWSMAGPLGEIHDASMPGGRAALFGFFGMPAYARRNVPKDVLRSHCRAQLARLFGPQAATPLADTLKDWALDPCTATDADLEGAAHHADAPAAAVPSGPWAGRLAGIASEWSPSFPGYLAGAVEAAHQGVAARLGTGATIPGEPS